MTASLAAALWMHGVLAAARLRLDRLRPAAFRLAVAAHPYLVRLVP